MKVVDAADKVNDEQKLLLFEQAKEHYGDLNGKTFAFWGLSFKPRTDDVREAPAKYLIKKFTDAGAKIIAYDPEGMKTAKEYFDAPFETRDDKLDVLEGADALFLVTEWNEFKNPNLDEMKKRLKAPVVFDGRNIYDPVKLKENGFTCYTVGRQRLVNRD